MQKTAATIVSIGLLAAGLATVTAAPASANPDTPLSANPSSMWQTNGDVDSLAVGNGILYAAGRFTRVRPPGAAAGTSETTRTYLAAFNASTGALITTFNVTLNSRVRAVRLSPDGSRLYIGGNFTTVNGVTRSRLAAVNPSTGALITGFAATPNGAVTTIAPSGNAVFVGGDFTTINGTTAMRVASVNATTGALNSAFSASLDARPRASAVASDGSRLLIGGTFQVVNGVIQPAIASLDPTTGATRPWASTGIVPRALAGGGCDSEVSDIVVSGSRAYVVSEGLQPGCFEGEYSAEIADGATVWDAQCLGASQSTAVIGSFVYRGSHMHDCGRTPGGFVGPRTSADFVWYRLNAMSISDGTFVHWSPNTNGAGSDHVGPHAMATDGVQLFVGGDFTSVGGSAQQGLTRFGPTGGNSTPATPLAPTVSASAAGTVTVVARGVADANNGMLTYQLFRNGASTPIATKTVESWPWSLPEVRFDDTGRAPGSSNSYRVSVTDGSATSALSPVSASVAVSGANPPAYATRVQGADPATYWRLDESSGPVVGSSASGAAGNVVGTVTRNQPGATPGGASITLGGSGYVAGATQTTHADAFSLTAMFKTTTRTGGTIVGYSADETGAATPLGSDRVVFMENDGKLAFAQRIVPVPPRGPSFAFVRSATTFRDGLWHQVTATYGAGFMNLYVDGDLQGTTAVVDAVVPGPGYLRAGYTDLTDFYLVFGRNYSNIPAPTSYYFTGSLDEVADFPTELSASQTADLWASSAAGLLGAAPGDASAPSMPGNLSATTTSTSVSLSWTASTDNVAVTGYEVRRGGTLLTTTAPGTLSFTDAGRTPSTAYAYTVTAIDAAANASVPASLSVTTDPAPGDTLAPSTPGGLAATTTSTSVSLSWSASTDNVAVTGYEVRRNGTLITTTGAGVLTFTDAGRAPSTAYTYTVTAIDAAANASVPASLSVTTDPAPVDNVAPSTPGGLAATTTSTSVSLSWSASTDNVAVTGYEVRRDGTLITTTGAGVLTFTDAGRTPDTTYAYTVTAVDAAGNASAPASRSATTDAVSGSLFSDTWTAANGSPWSSSWTTSVSNGTADTQGSAGQLAITDVSNAFARAQLTGSAAVADSDLLFSYRWSSGAPRAYFTVYQRGSGGWQNAYRPRTGYGLQLQSDSATVVLLKNVDGSSSSISSIAGANTVGTAKQWLRFRLVGQSLYVRVWADGTAEPATWTYSTTDSSVTTAGQTSLSLIRAGANAGAKSIAIDDLTLSGDTTPAPVDNVAPSTPGGLAATTTSTSVSLSWSASTDNVAVTGYEVRRNGTLITTTGAGVLTFTDAGRTPDTTYAYTVTAVDAAGNASAPASRSATTDAVSGSLFSDTWTAANGSPWSSSWTTSVSNGTADTQGSAGQLAITDVSNAFARAQLTGSAAVADSDLLFSYRWSSGAPRAYFTVYQRGSGGWQNAYRPRTGYGLQIQSDSGNVVLQRNVDGTVTTVSSLAGANQVGTAKQWVRFRIVGQSLYVRTWADGVAEPGTWTYTGTDASVSEAGQTFFSLNRSGSNVGVKALDIDDLTLSPATGP